jgi:GAF domain-containing protein
MSSENGTDTAGEGLDEASGYAALSKVVLADRPLSEVLEEVALLAKQMLTQAPEVSVTLLKGRQAQTAAFTGPLAIHLDERQYEKGFGPCLDAAVSGETIKLATDDPDSPYLDFCEIARRQGVTHSLSVGLPVATPTIGGLNVYSSTDRPLSVDAERIVGTFASFTGILLASAGLHSDLADLEEQLERAVQSRAIVDQAKGIIMAQNRCSGEEAFRMLVRASQDRNIKLRILAERLVASVAGATEAGVRGQANKGPSRSDAGRGPGSE